MQIQDSDLRLQLIALGNKNFFSMMSLQLELYMLYHLTVCIVDIIRWLTFQACPFRGHDESPGSLNRGNFLEMLKLLASYNKEVNEVVLENAPKMQNTLHLMSKRKF